VASFSLARAASLWSARHICYHKARVRLFCLAFLTGNPVVEVGINDKRRRGNEIVGRYDIIPVKTEDWRRLPGHVTFLPAPAPCRRGHVTGEGGLARVAVVKTEDWIRYEDVELHEIVDRDEYERSRLVKFRPVDAARCELMRFRVRPPHAAARVRKVPRASARERGAAAADRRADVGVGTADRAPRRPADSRLLLSGAASPPGESRTGFRWWEAWGPC